MAEELNYRELWAEGEIEACTLLDAIDDLRAQLPSQGGGAVAWARQCDLDESDPAIFVAREEVQESGYVVPLYTHKAGPDVVAVQEMKWLEQWLLLAAEPVGQECCGRAYLECCGNGEPVYRTADEIAAAMNARREELRQLLAGSEGAKK